MTRPHHPNVANRLMAAREAMLKPFRPIFRAHGVTGQQWRVIRALTETPEGLAPNEISQRCQIVPPSLSQILAGMEKRGLVARQRSESDLRMQRIVLTDDAVALADTLVPLIDQQYELIERAVGSNLLDEVIAVAERLRQSLEAGVPSVLDEQRSGESAAVQARRTPLPSPVNSK